MLRAWHYNTDVQLYDMSSMGLAFELADRVERTQAFSEMKQDMHIRCISKSANCFLCFQSEINTNINGRSYLQLPLLVLPLDGNAYVHDTAFVFGTFANQPMTLEMLVTQCNLFHSRRLSLTIRLLFIRLACHQSVIAVVACCIETVPSASSPVGRSEVQ